MAPRRLTGDGLVRVGALVLAGLFMVLFVAGALPSGLAFALGAAVVLLLAVWEGVVAHRHRHEAARFALAHGWEHESRTAAYNTRFGGDPFDLGGRSWQSDVLRGTFAGYRCATFTHVVEQGGQAGESKADSRLAFQVTLAELPVRLPRLDIVPESLVNRVAQALGAVDIEVESHAFNDRWRVVARDRRYGHDVVDPRMIARLLEHDAEGLAIRIDGGAVMVWTVGRESVDSLARRLAVVTGVARRIPGHVIRRFEEGHAMRDPDAPLSGPAWAVTPGALTSGRYTGVGVDADGDGVEDWRQAPPEPPAHRPAAGSPAGPPAGPAAGPPAGPPAGPGPDSGDPGA